MAISQSEPIVLKKHGKIQLVQDNNNYLVLGGKQVERYKSKTWAEKRYHRVNSLFSKE